MAVIREIRNRIKPPCKECPYKKGEIKTLRNPCPECKENGYEAYERFQKMMAPGEAPADRNIDY